MIGRYVIFREMFYHIVSAGEQTNLIGNGSRPPWYEKTSKKYFPRMTAGKIIIMSKRSFEKFGHKYEARKILLLGHGAMTLEEAMAETQDEKIVFIAGGASIFLQSIDMISGIYMAKIQGDWPGNIYYPEIPTDMKLKYVIPSRLSTVSLYYYERQWAYN